MDTSTTLTPKNLNPATQKFPESEKHAKLSTNLALEGTQSPTLFSMMLLSREGSPTELDLSNTENFDEDAAEVRKEGSKSGKAGRSYSMDSGSGEGLFNVDDVDQDAAKMSTKSGKNDKEYRGVENLDDNNFLDEYSVGNLDRDVAEMVIKSGKSAKEYSDGRLEQLERQEDLGSDELFEEYTGSSIEYTGEGTNTDVGVGKLAVKGSQKHFNDESILEERNEEIGSGGKGGKGKSEYYDVGLSDRFQRDETSEEKEQDKEIVYDEDMCDEDLDNDYRYEDIDNNNNAGTDDGTNTGTGDGTNDGTGSNRDSPIVDCGAISEGFGPTSSTLKSYRILYDVVIKADATIATVYSDMQNDLQINVAPVIAGCAKVRIPRRLQQTRVTNVRFEPTPVNEDTVLSGCDDEAIEAAFWYDGVCHPSRIPLEMYYDGADTSDFGNRIESSLRDHVWTVDGLVGVFGQSLEGEEIDSTSAIFNDNNPPAREKVGPLGYAAISMAAIALILVSLLLVRRSGEDNLMKHVELIDDSDDETYVKDIETETKSRSSSVQQNSARHRIAHVVGEEDSIMTGWTRYSYGKESTTSPDKEVEKWSPAVVSPSRVSKARTPPRLKSRAPPGSHNIDVHKCSSATCEVCEERLQKGIQFIPAPDANEIASVLPRDAAREYVADDTVYL